MTRFRRISLFLAAATAAVTLVAVGPGDTAFSAPGDNAGEAARRANEQVRAILDRFRRAQDPLNGRDGADGRDARSGNEPGDRDRRRDADERPRFGDRNWFPAG